MSQPAAIDAASIAIAGLTPPTQHSQLCPVWAKKATVADCNCWILHNAIQAARAAIVVAVPILAKATREQVAREIEAATGLWCPECGLHVHIRHAGKRHCLNDHEWPAGPELRVRECAAIARSDSGEGSDRG